MMNSYILQQIYICKLHIINNLQRKVLKSEFTLIKNVTARAAS